MNKKDMENVYGMPFGAKCMILVAGIILLMIIGATFGVPLLAQIFVTVTGFLCIAGLVWITFISVMDR
jgi:hypothetical protein